MPVPVSSLSVAVQGIADFLDSQFTEEVKVTVAHPQRAAEIAKGAGINAHCLNIFAYRVAPSGFHAGLTTGDAHFVRISALLTPFPADLDNAADDADMRILGHAIRVLQSHPVLPVAGGPLPGNVLPNLANPTEYYLQAVMLAPTMEEVNHIWTTQGGDLAYRLSAVYEFSLIPIEPLLPSEIAAPPRTLVLDTAVAMDDASQPFVEPGPDTRAFAIAEGNAAPPVAWAPVQMFVVGDTMLSNASIADDADEIRHALSGPAGSQAAVDVLWDTPGGEVAQPTQIVAIGSPRLDAPEARHDLVLVVPEGASGGMVRVRPAANGAPIADASFGNSLTLEVV